MKKFYVDTSIWRDLHENRKDRFRLLGEWAFEFFRQARAYNHLVLYSDLIIKELMKDYSEDEIKEILSVVSENKKKVQITKKQAKKSYILSQKLRIPFGDAMHAIIAKDNNAIMVTRDKHFLELLDTVKVKKPEELI